MALVRKFGKPSLFVTMTCNPNWAEIQENLIKHNGVPIQKAQDCPDLTARVFNLKLEAVLTLIKTHDILGRVVASCYVVEFQKRGLPHAHLVLILASHCTIDDIAIVDRIVSAEIPDISITPELHETVKAQMMHGPCGADNPNCPCMKDGVCSKGFPKPFVEETTQSDTGFPIYRRCVPAS